MQPYKIDMYVYANTADEAAALESKLKEFVSRKREQGIAVRADRISKALDIFADNPLLLTFLK